MPGRSSFGSGGGSCIGEVHEYPRARRSTHVRTWYERLTLFRALRTIAIIVMLLVLAGGVLVRVIEPAKFTSLGLAWWWAVETVTTVGYGDVVPVSTGGRSWAPR